jgi:hypothetical protein
MTEGRKQTAPRHFNRKLLGENKVTCFMKIMSIVIWDFNAVSGKSNRFYLNQLELALTFP